MRRWIKVSLAVVALVLGAVVGYGLFNYLSPPKQFSPAAWSAKRGRRLYMAA